MTAAADPLADFISRHAELNDPASSLDLDIRLRWWNLDWVELVDRPNGTRIWRLTALGYGLLAATTAAERDQAAADANAALEARLSEIGELPAEPPPSAAS